MSKKKNPNLVTTSVSLERGQLEWLEKNHYNLSSLTRAYLNEFIQTMEKTKTVVIPAWIKAADMEELKERAKKNPRLKRIVGE